MTSDALLDAAREWILRTRQFLNTSYVATSPIRETTPGDVLGVLDLMRDYTNELLRDEGAGKAMAGISLDQDFIELAKTVNAVATERQEAARSQLSREFQSQELRGSNITMKVLYAFGVSYDDLGKVGNGAGLNQPEILSPFEGFVFDNWRFICFDREAHKQLHEYQVKAPRELAAEPLAIVQRVDAYIEDTSPTPDIDDPSEKVKPTAEETARDYIAFDRIYDALTHFTMDNPSEPLTVNDVLELLQNLRSHFSIASKHELVASMDTFQLKTIAYQLTMVRHTAQFLAQDVLASAHEPDVISPFEREARKSSMDFIAEPLKPQPPNAKSVVVRDRYPLAEYVALQILDVDVSRAIDDPTYRDELGATDSNLAWFLENRVADSGFMRRLHDLERSVDGPQKQLPTGPDFGPL